MCSSHHIRLMFLLIEKLISTHLKIKHSPFIPLSVYYIDCTDKLAH